jgi:hypothetical protein
LEKLLTNWKSFWSFKLWIVAYQGEGAYEANVDYAHLTVVWSQVITDQAKYNSH